MGETLSGIFIGFALSVLLFVLKETYRLRGGTAKSNGGATQAQVEEAGKVSRGEWETFMRENSRRETRSAIVELVMPEIARQNESWQRQTEILDRLERSAGVLARSSESSAQALREVSQALALVADFVQREQVARAVVAAQAAAAGGLMFRLSTGQIATSVKAPAVNVAKSWPAIERELAALGIADEATCIAALATVAVECRNWRTPAQNFLPITELGGPIYFEQRYGGRVDLGNTEAGDGARYCGRGFIQITGRANYVRYSACAGCDLAAEPERALEPAIAAKILAKYFADHGMAKLAAAGMWREARRKVNGGTNGLADFLGYVQNLKAGLAASTNAMPAAGGVQ